MNYELKMLFAKLSDSDLINAYSLVLKELKDKGIIRSKNVLGDLGEYLIIKHYNNTPGLPNLVSAPPGTQNVDALSRKGDRYSIKSITGKATGVFYGLNEPGSDEPETQKFEFVVIAMFDDNYVLQRINELSWGEFLKYKKWHSRVRAWNLGISQELLDNTKTIFKN